jgi:hypothetical protein
MSQMTSLDPSPCAESKEKWNDTSVGKSSNGSIAFYVMEKKNTSFGNRGKHVIVLVIIFSEVKVYLYQPKIV